MSTLSGLTPILDAQGDASGVYTVAGNPGDAVRLDFYLQSGETALFNEYGVIRVDDAAGRINGLLPGNPSYQQEALANAERLSLFRGRPGEAAHFDDAVFRAGEHLIFYLATDCTANELQGMDTPPPGGMPLLLSTAASDADALGALRHSSLDTTLQLAWNDESDQGDPNFEDLVVQVWGDDGIDQGAPDPKWLSEGGPAIHLPGRKGDRFLLKFTLDSRETRSKNEIGIFLVDDAEGSIGNLKPGDRRYAYAAMQRGQSLFPRNARPRKKARVILEGDQYFGTYLIQNASRQQWLKKNPRNKGGKSPQAFFSFVAANPDGEDHISRIGPRLFMEDGDGLGDRSFQDAVVRFDILKRRRGWRDVNTRLGRDTGTFKDDQITSDPLVKGRFRRHFRVAGAKFVGAPRKSFKRVSRWVKGNGRFVFNERRLQRIYRGELEDGDYKLKVGAITTDGRRIMSKLKFTLDRQLPLSAQLDTADWSGVGTAQTQQDTLRIVGQAEPGALLTLLNTGTQTTADEYGQFAFVNVPLSIGENTLTIEGRDRAGNVNRVYPMMTRLASNPAAPDLAPPDQPTSPVLPNPLPQAPIGLTLNGGNIAETSPLDAVIGTFNSTDPDSYTYTLIDTATYPDNAAFKIVGNALHLNTVLDYETKSSYSIQVRTTNAAGLSFDQTFTLTVTDENEGPVFSSSPVLSGREDTPYTYDITASDPDAGDTLTLTGITLPSWLAFTDNGDGTATLTGTPTTSDLGSHDVVLEVQDAAGLTDTQSFTMTVNNTNDAPTDLSLTPTSSNENVAAGSVIGTFSSTDNDAGDTHTYTLVESGTYADNAAFTIDDDQLKFNTSPDFEVQDSYQIKVRTTDAAGESFDKVITITINDLNDAPTALTVSGTTIAENSALDSVLGTFSSTDEDAGGSHTYTFTDTTTYPDNAAFKIVGNQLQLNAIPDYETQSSYTIKVKTTDNSGLDFDQVFTITITDENEGPVFSSSPVLGGSEDALYSYNITVSDPDAGDTLTITDTTIPTWLTFTPTGNGTATLTGTPTNSNLGSHTVVLDVQDAAGLSATQSFTITVNNINDAPSDLSLTPTDSDENVAAGSVIGTFSTTDVDDGDSHSYSLVDDATYPDNTAFTIDGNQLKINAVPDFEAKNSYQIKVRTTDAAGDFFEKVITITINDLNEAPTALNVSGTTIAENSAVDAVIGTFSSTDEDAGATHTYTLIDTATYTDNAAFKIVGNELQLNAVPDFETQSSYTIKVKTTDNGGLDFDQVFTISITDENEGPTFTSSPVLGGSEDALYSYTITVSDPDAGDTLTITDSTIPTWLTFTDNGNGTATLTGTPTQSDVGSYTIVLTVQDTALLADTQSFSLTVNNVNDAPTDLTLTPTVAPENVVAGSVVGSLSTTDEDPGDSHTYSLVDDSSYPDNAAFTIDGTSLKINAAPDFETKSSYTVQIRTTDAAGAFFDKVVTIGITDVNESPTALTLDTATIAENNVAHAVVGSFSTTDVDAGDTHSYALVSGAGDTDNGKFSIVGNQLQINDPADFEGQNSFLIRVQTADAGGLSTEQTFTISITDVNEAPTTLTLDNTAIAENNLAGAVIGTFSSTDEDAGDTHTYSLVAGTGDTDNGKFSIVGNQLTINDPADFEGQNSFDVRVQTADAGGLSVEQTFTITITDVNEAPVLTAVANQSVDEESTLSFTVSVTDPEADVLSFSLDGAPTGASIDPVTGVFAWTPTEAQGPTTESITVRVSDGSLFDTVSFEVTVNEVNQAPVLVDPGSPIAAALHLFTLALSATDADLPANTLFYTLGADAPTGMSIDGNTGVVSWTPALDQVGSHEVTVTVSDGDLTDTHTLSILVKEPNIAPTNLVFTPTWVKENSGEGTVIGSLSTYDPNAADTHTYTLVNDPSGFFQIVGDEVQVAPGAALDFETATAHTVTIRTTDDGLPDALALEREFTIAVRNVNEVPTLIALSNDTIAENSEAGVIIGSFATTDPDVGDSHSYMLVDDADGRFELVSNQLRVAADADLDFEASPTHSITVRSTDNGLPAALSHEQTFTITLTDVNEAPEFTSTPVVTANTGDVYQYAITTVDPEGDAIIITAADLPAWVTTFTDYGDGTALLEGTPTPTDTGIYAISFTASDGALETVQDLLLTVDFTLVENSDFAPDAQVEFSVPVDPSLLQFKIDSLVLDYTDDDSINDAFEVALLDANGDPMVHVFDTGRDAFFNWTEGEPYALAPGVTYDVATQTVSLNLTGLTPAETVNLVFRLVNNDDDTTSQVSITDIEFIDAPAGTVPPIDIPASTTQPDPIALPTFNGMEDVSASIQPLYGITSFKADQSLLFADLSLENIGTYSLSSPLLVTVEHISDPSVSLWKPDGYTPDGKPYYNFSDLVADGTLDAGETSASGQLVFRNPNQVQFDYDLVVLSVLNEAPEITSDPLVPGTNKAEVIAGKTYTYDVVATDPDNDNLTYTLKVAPAGLTIDSATGVMTWSTSDVPATDVNTDIGNHSIVVEVSDGRGGKDIQSFTLSVIELPPNRPPIFTSDPVVDAFINQLYEYDADAFDPDEDYPLSYDLVLGPDGMTVDVNTGEVVWTPSPMLILGDTVLGRSTAPGENTEFTFSGAEGQIIYFDPLKYDGTASNWDLKVYSPSGELVLDSDLGTNKLLELLEDGNYRVVINPTGSQTGGYGLTLIDTEQTPSIAFDTLIEGTLSPGSESDVFRFTGNAGQKVFFDYLSIAGGSANWYLYDPDNIQVFATSFSDQELYLPKDGEYRLVLDGISGFNTVTDYSFELITPDEIIVPLTLGNNTIPNAVYTTISEKGEEDYYTFTGTKGQRLFFDHLEHTDRAYVSLYGPGEQQLWINHSLWDSKDRVPFTLPQDGTYRLEIDGYSEDIGDYGFSLLDLGNADPIALDTVYTKTLPTGYAAQMYQFIGNAGQHLYFDSIADGSGITWQLYDSGNQLITERNFTSGDRDLEVVLEETETYTLIFRGGSSSTVPVNYSFEIITPDTVTQTINLDTVTSGASLTEQGEQDVFTFSGTQGQLLFLDSSINTGASDDWKFYGKLTTPSGSTDIVNWKGEAINDLNGSTSARMTNDPYRLPFMLPETGIYTFTVDGDWSKTGDYEFQFINVSAAPTVPMDTVQNGTLKAQEIQFYQFEGTEGDRIFFDSLASMTNTNWHLYDGTGRELRDDLSMSSDFEYQLPTTGTYYLELRSEHSADQSFSFKVVPTTDSTTAYSLGTVQNGTISKASEQDVYTFTGTAGQRLYFDPQSGSSNITTKLYTPEGHEIFSGNTAIGSDSADIFIPRDGQYRLVVDGNTDTTGAYSFQLLDWATQPALPIGSALNGTLTAGTSKLYKFNGTYGQSLSMDSLASASGSWDFYSPTVGTNNLTKVASAGLGSDFESYIAADGTYILALRNTTGTPVTYSVQVNNTTTAGSNSGFGLYDSTISTSGEVDEYTIAAKAGTLVYLDSQGTNVNLRSRLYDPDNTLVFNEAYNDRDHNTYVLDETATYRFQVYGSGSTTGAYKFNVLNLNDAPTLTLNSNTSVSLAPRETKAYKFTGNGGDRIWIDGLDTTASTVSLMLITPNGNALVDYNSYYDYGLRQDPGFVQLPTKGTYYVLVQSDNTADSTAKFKLATETAATTLPMDTEITGSFPTGRESQVYTFNGTKGSRLYFDSISASNYVYWQLHDPSGQALPGSNTANYMWSNSDREVVLPSDGEYMLTIYTDRSAATSGVNYTFKTITSPDTTTNINLGDVVTGNIDELGERNRYEVDLTAGQQLYFDALTGDIGDIYWRLYSPSGEEIIQQHEHLNDYRFITESGTYTIEVDSGYYQYSLGAYSFRLLDIAATAAANPISLDTPISGDASGSYADNIYQFSGTAGQDIYLDHITGAAHHFNIKVLDSSGASIYSQGFSDREAVLTLPVTDNYALILESRHDYVSGAYEFELVTPDWQTAAYTIGTTVTNQITEAGERDFYTFTATAGQSLFFDALDDSYYGGYSGTDYYLYWRLYAPSGEQVFSTSDETDQWFTMEETGTYTLEFDGNRDHHTAPYSFRIFDYNQEAAANVITVDALVAGDFGDTNRRETDVYSFTASAGDNLFLNPTAGDNSNSWGLYDPYGNQLAWTQLNYNNDVHYSKGGLPYDGTYTLRLSSYGTTANTYEFTVWSSEHITTPYTLGDVISTDISEMGEEDAYTFEGTNGQTLYIDSQSDDNDLRWDLISPSGKSLLVYYGVDDRDNQKLDLTETGTYTFVVNPYSYAHTGNYQFRIVDWNEEAEANPLVLDTLLSGDFGTSQREDHLFQFSATRGEKLFFDRTVGHSGNWGNPANYWGVYDQQGNQLAWHGLGNDFEFVAPYTGDYVLHLQGNANSENNYAVEIVTSSTDPVPYTLGNTITSDIAVKGEEDTYSFEATTGQTFYFDGMQGNSNLDARLYSPSGVLIMDKDTVTDTPLTFVETGTYRLVIDGDQETTGAYSFVLSDRANTPEVIPATPTSGILNSTTTTVLYEINGTAGQQLKFDFSSAYYSAATGHTYSQTSNAVTWDVAQNQAQAIGGNLVTINDATENQFILDTFGSNRWIGYNDVAVEGTWEWVSGESATYENWRVGEPNGSTGSNYGLLYWSDGTWNDVGATHNAYGVAEFNDAAVPDVNTGNVTWKLYGPTGQEMVAPSAANPDFTVGIPADGTYTLALTVTNNKAAKYDFDITDVTPAPITTTGVTEIDQATGTVTPPFSLTLANTSDVQSHTFTATAGTLFFLDTTTVSSGSIWVRLRNPDGTLAFENRRADYINYNHYSLFRAEQTGTYTLEAYNAPGTWSFTLSELPNDLSSDHFYPLEVDSVNTDGIQPGYGSTVRSFVGEAGQQIRLNTPFYQQYARLVDSSGKEIFYIGPSWGWTRDTNVYTLEQDGIYHLILSGNSSSNVPFALQLSNLGTAQSVEFAQVVNGQLADGRADNYYTFEGEVGQNIFVDIKSGHDSSKAFQIFKPSDLNNPIKSVSHYTSYDFDLELPETGTYVIRIKGQDYTTTSTAFDYSFQIFNDKKPAADVLVPGTGESGSADGSLAQLPVKIEVIDALGASSTQSYNVRLWPDPDNNAPVITSIPADKVALDRRRYDYQIVAVDPDGDTPRFRLLDGPNGSILDQDTGELVWFPEGATHGDVYDFTVEVVDGRGGSNTQTFSVQAFNSLGKVEGAVFEDININGFRDTVLVEGDDPTIVFSIDVSGSVGGSTVDWANTPIDEFEGGSIYDMERATVLALAQQLVAQGREDVKIGVVIWSQYYVSIGYNFYGTNGQALDLDPTTPGTQFYTTPLADKDGDGVLDLAKALDDIGKGSSSFIPGGGTNFDNGLNTAKGVLDSLPGDPNLIFLSDGYGNLTETIPPAILADGVNLKALGVGDGASLEQLQKVDPDAVQVTTSRDLLEIFSGLSNEFSNEPLVKEATVYLDLNNDDSLDEGEPWQITQIPDATDTGIPFQFSFENLEPGDYTLRLIAPAGYTSTPVSPGNTPFNFTITTDGEAVVQFFGVQKQSEPANSVPILITSDPSTNLYVGDVFQHRVEAVDPDGEAVTFELTLAPEGMGIDAETGNIVWIPNEDQVGDHNVIVRVKDDEDGFVLQSFSLLVEAPNIAPTFTTEPDTTEVQATREFRYWFDAYDANGDALDYTLIDAPSGLQFGNLASTNPTVFYGKPLIFWTPTAGQVGTHTFSLQVEDPRGGVDIQEITLEVIPYQPNHTPTISSTPRDTGRSNTAYMYQVVAEDEDNDKLTYELTTAPTGASIDADNGLISWMPTSDQFGTHSFTVKVTDAEGAWKSQSWSVGISNRLDNSAPEFLSKPILVGNVQQGYRYEAIVVDPDGDPVLLSVEEGPDNMVVNEQTGVITWQPEVKDIGKSHAVRLQAMDIFGVYVSQEFDVTVRGVNTPPSIQSYANTRAAQDQLYTYQAAATDVDGNAITYDLGIRPMGMTITSEGLVQWTPTADDLGTHTVQVLARDEFGGVDTQDYTLSVSASAVNHVPEITSTAVFLGTTSQPYTYQVTATDSDGDPLTYGLVDAPSGMTINSSTGEVTWSSPTQGEHSVIVSVNDGQLGAGQGYTLTVIVDEAPIFSPLTTAPTDALPNELYNYDVNASDPNGGTLTYSIDGASEAKGITIDEAGRLRWTPDDTQLGSHSITITVTDETGTSTDQTIMVNVAEDTTPPLVDLNAYDVYVVGTDYIADLGMTAALRVNATDNVGVLGVELFVDGTPLTLDNQGMGSLELDTVGIYTLEARATDRAGNTATDSIVITVTDPSVPANAPEIEFDLDALGNGTITSVTDILGKVDDPDDNLSEYRVDVAPIGTEDWVPMFSGTSEVAWSTVMGQFDPTFLSDGSYRMRLYAEDLTGLASEIEAQVDVASGNLKLGDFQVSFTDLEVNSNGLPVSLIRTYDTLAIANESDMAPGWRLEFRNVDLRSSLGSDGLYDEYGLRKRDHAFDDDTKVFLTVPGAGRQVFEFEPEGSRFNAFFSDPSAYLYHPKFKAVGGTTATLEISNAMNNGALLLKDPDGKYRTTGGTGYDPADPSTGAKYILTTEDGIVYEINPQTNKVDKITSPDDESLYLTLTDASITSSLGEEIILERDAQNRIISVTGNDGQVVSYSYDANGDLVTVTDQNGMVTRFEYKDVGGIWTQSHYLEEVIDPLGRTGMRNQYNEQGRLVGILDVNGNLTEFSYDPDNQREEVIDPLGNTTINFYDDSGNLVQEVDALGGIHEYTYDTENHLTSYKDPLGNTWSMSYDSQGNMTEQAFPTGLVETYTVDSKGRQTGGYTSTGDFVKYFYDDDSNAPYKYVDSRGVIHEYKESGDDIQLLINGEQVGAATYNADGLMTKEVDIYGNETHYTYNNDGDLIEEKRVLKDAQGTSEFVVNAYSYDDNARQVTITDASGNVQVQQYDDLWRLTSESINGEQLASYGYDTSDRVNQVTYWDGTSESIHYDALGRPDRYVDRNGLEFRREYNAMGWETAFIYPDATPADWTDNPRQEWEYDALGRVTKEIATDGSYIEMDYTSTHEDPTSVRYYAAAGTLLDSITYEYDENGRLIADVTATGDRTEYSYDASGRMIQAIKPNGEVVNYDPEVLNGEMDSAITVADDRGANWTYDRHLMQINEVTDPLGYSHKYTYNRFGEVATFEDAKGNLTRYTYDDQGRTTGRILSDGKQETISYLADNVMQIKDFKGNTFERTINDQEVNTKLVLPDSTEWHYRYNDFGQLLDITTNSGDVLIAYTYDGNGNVIEKQQANGHTISYDYTPEGLLEEVTSDGHTTTYTYGSYGRLTQVTDNLAGNTQYTYDDASKTIEITSPSGMVEALTFDTFGYIDKQIFKDAAGTVLASYQYTREDGYLTQVVENAGMATEQTIIYTYDDRGQMVKETYDFVSGPDRTITYTYDGTGNRTERVDSLDGTTTYSYSNNGELIETIGIDGSTIYTYDENGNLVQKNAPDGETTIYDWNDLNWLTGVTIKDNTGTVTHAEQYAYDPLGNRIQRTVNGDTFDLVVDDVQSEYGVVRSIYNSSGDRIDAYVYDGRGNSPLAQLHDNGGSTDSYYFGRNYRGSTEFLTDDTATVTDTYDYDAYGRILQSTGSSAVNHLYNGEWFNEDTGLQHLRARYLNPDAGQFISRDPVYQGEIENPITRNQYLYVQGDPVNNIDPSGLFSLGELNVAQVMQNILRNIKQPQMWLTLKANIKRLERAMSALAWADLLLDMAGDYVRGYFPVGLAGGMSAALGGISDAVSVGGDVGALFYGYSKNLGPAKVEWDIRPDIQPNSYAGGFAAGAYYGVINAKFSVETSVGKDQVGGNHEGKLSFIPRFANIFGKTKPQGKTSGDKYFIKFTHKKSLTGIAYGKGLSAYDQTALELGAGKEYTLVEGPKEAAPAFGKAEPTFKWVFGVEGSGKINISGIGNNSGQIQANLYTQLTTNSPNPSQIQNSRPALTKFKLKLVTAYAKAQYAKSNSITGEQMGAPKLKVGLKPFVELNNEQGESVTEVDLSSIFGL